MQPNIKLLHNMLTYRRPAGSTTEREFIHRYIRPLGTKRDYIGNHILRIGTNPLIMFTSHTDSVHRQPGRQRIYIDKYGYIGLPQNTTSNCLGADDAAGVWLMRELILRRVPALYVFQGAEEIGGIGSDYIATTTPKLLTDIKYCISLDRRGYSSVITHQGTRCCSDAFAESLCQQLGPYWQPDPTGLFTDSANYTALIPECTNLSVGYNNEHTADEHLYVPHLVSLLTALTNLQPNLLQCTRNPKTDTYWDEEFDLDYPLLWHTFKEPIQ
jgi:acetylornithine deacetylase/succinyl-diaminopimelate desuccinylase-like protein